jgi:sugar/nucleoside kinase (ribokinase family)
MLDTGWDPAGWPADTLSGLRQVLRNVAVFMPNVDEARVLGGGATAEEAAMNLQTYGPELVVVKCGERGSIARRGQKSYQVPALPSSVFDTVGAGDTFDAGFLFGYLKGWPAEACLAFGNAAASIYISRAHHRYPGMSEVISAAKAYSVDLPELGKLISDLTQDKT